MKHMNANRLTTISAMIEDAHRCILQAAMKGHVSDGHKERIETMLKEAASSAARLEPETKPN